MPPPPTATSQPFPSTTSNPNVIYSNPYSDPGYLQMALGAYLTPSSSVYKSVDPYFLSQGEWIRYDVKTQFIKFEYYIVD